MTPEALEEVNYLRRRYGERLSISVAQKTVRVRLEPPQRELPVRVDNLTLEAVLPSGYPSQEALADLAVAGSLPPNVLAAITKVVQKQFRVAPSSAKTGQIKAAVQWLDNHLPDLLRELISLQAEARAQAEISAPDTIHEHAQPTSPSKNEQAHVAQQTDSSQTTITAANVNEAGPATLTPWQEMFAQDWSHAQQRALEDALRETLALGANADPLLALASSWKAGAGGTQGSSGGKRGGMVSSNVATAADNNRAPSLGSLLFSKHTWQRVAAAVGGGKSPEDCCARYLLCRRVAQSWRDARYPSATAKVEEAQQAAEAAAAAAAADAASSRVALDQLRYGSRRDEGLIPGPGQPQKQQQWQQREHEPVARAAAGFARMRIGERDALYREHERDSDEDGDGESRLGRAAAAAGPPEEEEGSDDDDQEDHDEGDEEASGEDEEEDEIRDGSGEDEEPGAAHDHGDEAEEEEDEDSDVLPAFVGLHLKPQHAGYQLLLTGLSLYGIGSLACSRLAVNAQCGRCATLITATLRGVSLPGSGAAVAAATAGDSAAGGGPSSTAPSGPLAVAMVPASLLSEPSYHASHEYKGWCPKCSLLLSLYLRLTLVHEGCPSLGYIDATHATVAGVADTSLFLTCLECGGVADVKSFAAPGAKEMSCRVCFSRLRLAARGLDIAQATAATDETSGAAARQPPRRVQRFIPGRALPENGACKHYKRSFRWLRFPCCQRAFPCDGCHDEASDHPHEWALRMICGHCSREQPYANAPCVGCGKAMGKGSGAPPRFWEGGQGQRNRALLSRRDPRKYKNSALKTKSKKAERVGAAGKAHRAAAAQGADE